jgi:hypothetical protein
MKGESALDKNQNLDWLAALFLENEERIASLPMVFMNSAWTDGRKENSVAENPEPQLIENHA